MGLSKDKVVIITGAGSGLGKETALFFAKEGARLAICGRRFEKLQAVLNELESGIRENVLAIEADVSKEEDVQRFVQQVSEKFGKIDVLFNNAAVFESYYIADTSLESWNYHLANNLTSVFLMSKEVIPLMRNQKSGKIINLTSSLAKTGAAGFGAYSSSKAAIEILTASIDEEESSNGIIAHTFDPGVMKSNLQGSGVHPSVVAPYLLKLALSDDRFAGKVVDIEHIV
jgi:3-oxoacyl-[acyl-carrier protein] reductase